MTKNTLALALCCLAATALMQPARAGMDVHWDEGATDCDASPRTPLQVHAYDATTYILRQNPCAHFEANFVHLLIGRDRALLIDSGAVADAARMPLADTVLGLLPRRGGAPLPLVVTHTHGHRDHRMGDAQFADRPGVHVVPDDPDAMRAYFGLEGWPHVPASIELGDRRIAVIPAPGHHPDHLVFHDARTGLLFSGDFLLPGRLLVDDLRAYRASTARLIAFLDGRPVSHVLGGHLELDVHGRVFPRNATHRRNQRPLELARQDLLVLDRALASFNGFHARHPGFVLVDPVRNLMLLGGVVAAVLTAATWVIVRACGRRRRASGAGGA